jgi:hypothetical protein
MRDVRGVVESYQANLANLANLASVSLTMMPKEEAGFDRPSLPCINSPLPQHRRLRTLGIPAMHCRTGGTFWCMAQDGCAYNPFRSNEGNFRYPRGNRSKSIGGLQPQIEYDARTLKYKGGHSLVRDLGCAGQWSDESASGNHSGTSLPASHLQAHRAAIESSVSGNNPGSICASFGQRSALVVIEEAPLKLIVISCNIQPP